MNRLLGMPAGRSGPVAVSVNRRVLCAGMRPRFLPPSTKRVLPSRLRLALTRACAGVWPRLLTTPVTRKRSAGVIRLPAWTVSDVTVSGGFLAAVWTDVSTNTADADGFWTYTTFKAGTAQQFFRAVAR